jgi:putative two-component system response regulator
VSAVERPVVLCVDDTPEVLALLVRALGAEYQVLTSANPGNAISLALGQPTPDLILLDVDMPQVSGFEVCRALKAEARTARIPIIFLTSHTEAESQLEGLALGAVDYLGKSTSAALLKARVRTHVALANQRLELERLVRLRTQELDRTRTELIRRLARALEFHESSAVGNRVMRLSNYAKLLSQAAGAKPEVAEMMMQAAPLHDIGKLGVPTEILRRAGRLFTPDWEQVKRHPQIGAEIIGEHDDPLLKLARVLAFTHHEHWDGSGYPQRLKGEAIPWAGRVMAIVDSFESLTTTQFHRAPVSPDKAAEEIIRHAGKKYDPALMEAFQKALPVMKKVRETFSDKLGDLIDLDFAPAAPPPAAKPAAPPPAPKPAAPRADSAAQARADAKKYK